jgi:hypothetical protein
MKNLFSHEVVTLFRLPSALLLCSATAFLSALLGLTEAPVGMGIGYSLFVLNAFFLYEGGRSLLSTDSSGKGRMIAILASLGRMAFLAVALAFVARMGTQVLLFACGGLLLGQVNLHLSHLFKRRAARCSNT